MGDSDDADLSGFEDDGEDDFGEPEEGSGGDDDDEEAGEAEEGDDDDEEDSDIEAPGGKGRKGKRKVDDAELPRKDRVKKLKKKHAGSMFASAEDFETLLQEDF